MVTPLSFLFLHVHPLSQITSIQPGIIQFECVYSLTHPVLLLLLLLLLSRSFSSNSLIIIVPGKPWAVLLFEYLPEGPDAIAPSTLYTLGKQVTAHVLWRKAFFTASGDRPPGDTPFFNYLPVTNHHGYYQPPEP